MLPLPVALALVALQLQLQRDRQNSVHEEHDSGTIMTCAEDSSNNSDGTTALQQLQDV